MNMKAFVGISINSPYFSKENLLNYVHYIDGINNLNISELAFLIGDTPYALTYAALNKTSISKSLNIVKNKGDDFLKAIKNFLKKETGLSFITRIIKWKDITSCQFYTNLHFDVLTLYHTNIDFKKLVREQVYYNLSSKLKDKYLNDFENTLLDRYVLDEIAGLLTMSEFFDYKYEIYPGKDLFIIEKIISGDYKLLEKYNREFINLKFD